MKEVSRVQQLAVMNLIVESYLAYTPLELSNNPVMRSIGSLHVVGLNALARKAAETQLADDKVVLPVDGNEVRFLSIVCELAHDITPFKELPQ